jgi:hypothetical protein
MGMPRLVAKKSRLGLNRDGRCRTLEEKKATDKKKKEEGESSCSQINGMLLLAFVST